MVRWLLFAHVIGVAFWLGGAAALLVLQRMSRKIVHDGVDLSEDARRLTLGTMGTVVRWILTPSAAVVLLSGPAMMMAMGIVGMAKPFWLVFMERFGGLVSLVSIVLLTWQMRKLERADSGTERVRRLNKMGYALTGVSAATAATVLIVMLRL